MGRASRSWEDSPGEQLRGGAGGRGRRGRGRGSPRLAGAGDASTADRKSKVGAGQELEAQRLCAAMSLSVLPSRRFSPSPIVLCLSLSSSLLPLLPPPDQCL